jgi:hypothetical protein
MDTTYNFRLGLAQGRESKGRRPNQLFKRQALQKISTRMSLVVLFLGFSIFGILIIVHRHQADLSDLVSGSSVVTVGGIISILVGAVFLVSAYLLNNAQGPKFFWASIPAGPSEWLSTRSVPKSSKDQADSVGTGASAPRPTPIRPRE